MPQVAGGRHLDLAATGPGPMDQENPVAAAGAARSRGRCNGAWPYGPGEPALDVRLRRVRGAAMGPGPMDQENDSRARTGAPGPNPLQWGLALWTRRTRHVAAGGVPGPASCNGAWPYGPGEPSSASPSACSRSSCNGAWPYGPGEPPGPPSRPPPGVAGCNGAWPYGPGERSASSWTAASSSGCNGAWPYGPGERPYDLLRNVRFTALQWGLALWTRRTRTGWTGCNGGSESCNGAWPYGPGEPPPAPAAAAPPSGCNGAWPYGPGEPGTLRACRRAFSALQWGLALWTRRTTRYAASISGNFTLQWGLALWTRRTLGHDVPPDFSHVAAMGPGPMDQENRCGRPRGGDEPERAAMGPGPMDQENLRCGHARQEPGEAAAMGPGPMDQENLPTALWRDERLSVLQWGLALWTRRTLDASCRSGP